jgi:putative methanogenesis marker 16 metalloprotein
MAKKTIEEINRRIKKGKAIVMTAAELCDAVREGERFTPADVDVVTTGTCGLMSGTAAVLSFPFCGRNVFRKAEMVWLNGIPAIPGPAPNERLGEIDAIVYATATSVNNPRYGGGHLFREMVEGKCIDVRVRTTEGKTLTSATTLNGMTHARILATRNAFKNYMGFVNTKSESVKTIFHLSGMTGPYKELTFCGCGEINPVEKDPVLSTIGIGTRCLINGAVGYITGPGTRSTPERPSLSGFADMRGMKPEYMGGFVTAAGPESISSWAVPLPVLDDKILENAKKLDGQTRLPVADVHDRMPFFVSDYGKVWQGVDLNIRFDRSICTGGGKPGRACAGEGGCACRVEAICPTGAFSHSKMKIDKSLCFNCGACVRLCPRGAFLGRLGTVNINGKKVPVTLRQSNRMRAEQIASELKRRIENGSFLLARPAEKMSPGSKGGIQCGIPSVGSADGICCGGAGRKRKARHGTMRG